MNDVRTILYLTISSCMVVGAWVHSNGGWSSVGISLLTLTVGYLAFTLVDYWKGTSRD